MLAIKIILKFSLGEWLITRESELAESSIFDSVVFTSFYDPWEKHQSTWPSLQLSVNSSEDLAVYPLLATKIGKGKPGRELQLVRFDLFPDNSCRHKEQRLTSLYVTLKKKTTLETERVESSL